MDPVCIPKIYAHKNIMIKAKRNVRLVSYRELENDPGDIYIKQMKKVT